MSARGPLGSAGNGAGPPDCASLLLATDVGEAKGGLAVAAAIAVALAVEEPRRASGVLLAELGGERGRGPTMLASAPARELEEGLRRAGFERVAARGRLCWLGLPGSVEALGELPRVLAAVPAASLAIVHLPARLWPLALEEPGLRPCARAASRRSSKRPAAGGAGSGRASRASPRCTGRPAAARPGCLAPCHGRPGDRWRGRQARAPARSRAGRTDRRACRGPRPGAAHGAGRGVRDPVRGLVARGARGRAHRDGPGAARRGPGRALRRTLAARRLPAAVHAAAASRRSAEPASSGPARVPGTSLGGGAPGRRPKRRRSRPAATLVPRRRLLRAASPAGRGHRVSRPGRPSGAAWAVGRERIGRRRRHPDRGPRRGRGGVCAFTGANGRLARDRHRRRLLGTARLPAGQGHAPRCRRGLRPAGRRGAPGGDLAGDHLGVSLRRRAGAPVRRASRPPVGGAAGPIASPVRDRARPRAVVRVPVAGHERVPLRLPEALQLGTLAFRFHPWPGALFAAADSSAFGRLTADGADAGAAAFRPSCPSASGRQSCAPRRAGTSPPGYWPRS